MWYITVNTNYLGFSSFRSLNFCRNLIVAIFSYSSASPLPIHDRGPPLKCNELIFARSTLALPHRSGLNFSGSSNASLLYSVGLSIIFREVPFLTITSPISTSFGGSRSKSIYEGPLILMASFSTQSRYYISFKFSAVKSAFVLNFWLISLRILCSTSGCWKI